MFLGGVILKYTTEELRPGEKGVWRLLQGPCQRIQNQACWVHGRQGTASPFEHSKWSGLLVVPPGIGPAQPTLLR